MIAHSIGTLRRIIAVGLPAIVLALTGPSAFAVNYQLGGAQFPFNDVNATDGVVKDTFELCIDPAGDKCFPVSIMVKDTDTAADKAGKLIKAINGSKDSLAKNVKAIPLIKNGKPVDGAFQIKGINSIKGVAINSDQNDKVIALGNIVPHDGGVIAGGTTGAIGFGGSLTGLAGDGSVSTFTASFDFGTVNDDVTLAYGDLTTATIDGLLTQIFDDLHAGLPAGIQPDLTLDLADQAISFDFPGGAEDPAVGVSTNDASGTTNFALSGVDVPEPATAGLVGSGLLLLHAVRRRRAKVVR